MASERQLAANRRNSLRSTGPRTEAGRRASSLNALKHGFRSPLIVLPHENQPEFDALLEAFTFEAQPRSPGDLAAVRKIAACEWRLRRLVEVEACMFKKVIENPGAAAGSSPFALIAHSFLDGRITPFTALARYEASLDRQYRSAWGELDARPSSAQMNPIQETDQPAQTNWTAGVTVQATAQTNPIPAPAAPATVQTKPIGGVAISAIAKTKPIQETCAAATAQAKSTGLSAIQESGKPKPIPVPVPAATAQTKPIGGPEIPASAQSKPIQKSDPPAATLLAARSKSPASAGPIARNAPCPCGSGRKHKRCCGPHASALLCFPARHPERAAHRESTHTSRITPSRKEFQRAS